MFFLMRHAEASYKATSDRERPLTQEGIKSVKQLIKTHQKELVLIEKIVCSPYLRTQQTADIIAEYLKIDSPVLERNITPNNSIGEAIRALEKHWCENLLIITHQPLIGELVCFLEYGNTGLRESVNPASIYSYLLPWPGLACAQRKSLFSV